MRHGISPTPSAETLPKKLSLYFGLHHDFAAFLAILGGLFQALSTFLKLG